jgi:hypothetical protein
LGFLKQGNVFGAIFVLILYRVKKFASILFAVVILLSSGLAQFMLHICPEDGAMFSADACAEHNVVAPEGCCSESTSFANAVNEDCCTDTYVFALSAKFGAVESFQIDDQSFLQLQPISSSQNSEFHNSLQTVLFTKLNLPPPGGRLLLEKVCMLTI